MSEVAEDVIEEVAEAVREPVAAPVAEVTPVQKAEAADQQPEVAETKADKEPSNRRPPEPKVRSNPTFDRTITLNSLQSQRVFMRTIKYMSKALFDLGVIMHVNGEPTEAQQTEEIVSNAINKVALQLDDAFKRSQAVIDDAGNIAPLAYTSVVTRTLQLRTPMINRYLNLIEKMDRVVMNIDALWLAGEIEGGARSSNNAEWQRTVIRLSNEILNIKRRAQAAVENKGKAEELEKHGVTMETKQISEEEVDTEDDELDNE